MKTFYFCLLLTFFSCGEKHTSSTEKTKPICVDSFLIHNKFDSTWVRIFNVDRHNRYIVVLNDTAWEKLPLQEGSYIYRDNGIDRKISYGVGQLMNQFTGKTFPDEKVYIDEAEINQCRKDEKGNLGKSKLVWFLFGKQLIPEQVTLIENDFDEDGQKEWLVNMKSGETGYACILEKRKEGYEPIQVFPLSSGHHDLEFIEYDQTLNLFKMRVDRWGSCMDFDMKYLFAYSHDSIVYGPMLARDASSATNCDPDTGTTFMYYIGTSSKMISIKPGDFIINTYFSLSAYNLRTEKAYDDLFHKNFSLHYSLRRTDDRFVLLNDTTVNIEEDYFAEPFRFLEASKSEILKLRKYGSEKTRARLKDFDYFEP